MLNRVIKLCIPQLVRVRKYDVDKDELSNILRSRKKELKLSNKYIAHKLNKPQTLVEHWFRSDNCFAIPDEDIWFKLKSLLKIDTDKFDKPITTFIYKKGVFEQSERYYLDIGIAPSLTTLCDGNKIVVKQKRSTNEN